MRINDFDSWLVDNGYSSVHTGRIGEYFRQRDDDPEGPASIRIFVADGDEFELVAEKEFSGKYKAMGPYDELTTVEAIEEFVEENSA